MKPKLDKSGWPLEWIIFQADDLCRGDYKKGSRCCSLGGMTKNLYGEAIPDEIANPRQQRYIRLFYKAAKHLIGQSGGSVVVINDDENHSLALIARINNLAAAMLGYVVNNPETKTLRKMEASNSSK